MAITSPKIQVPEGLVNFAGFNSLQSARDYNESLSSRLRRYSKPMFVKWSLIIFR